MGKKCVIVEKSVEKLWENCGNSVEISAKFPPSGGCLNDEEVEKRRVVHIFYRFLWDSFHWRCE